MAFAHLHGHHLMVQDRQNKRKYELKFYLYIMWLIELKVENKGMKVNHMTFWG